MSFDFSNKTTHIPYTVEHSALTFKSFHDEYRIFIFTVLDLQAEATTEASTTCPSDVSGQCSFIVGGGGVGVPLFFVSGVVGTSILATSPLLAPLFGSSVGLIGIGNNYLSAL